MTHRHDKESLQLENRRAAKNRVPWEQRRRASMETGSGCRLHHRYLLGFEQIQSLNLSYHKIKGKPLSGVFWSLMEIGALWWSSTLLSISRSRSSERMTPGCHLFLEPANGVGGGETKSDIFLVHEILFPIWKKSVKMYIMTSLLPLPGELLCLHTVWASGRQGHCVPLFKANMQQ